VGEPIKYPGPWSCRRGTTYLRKVQKEKTEHYETVLMTKAGRRLDISLTMSPINGSEGNVVRTSTVTQYHQRKEAERRLVAQHTVCILAGRPRSAQLKILRSSARDGRWRGFWNLDRPADVLRCVQTWHVPSADVAQFEAARQHLLRSVACLVKSGIVVSLPGAAAEDANFLRASVAAKVGLRGGCLSDPPGEEVLGVLGFYSQEIRQPTKKSSRCLPSAARSAGL